MKNIVSLLVILLSSLVVGCHEDNLIEVSPNGGAFLYDIPHHKTVYGTVEFIVSSDGAAFHFQDAIGFLNWNWAFYDGKVKIDEGKAVFDSVLNLGEGLTLGFEAKDETATNVQTIFEDDIEKPYRYFDITILPNQSIKVREFTIELTPVPDRNYAVFPTRIKFTQHAGVGTGE